MQNQFDFWITLRSVSAILYIVLGTKTELGVILYHNIEPESLLFSWNFGRQNANWDGQNDISWYPRGCDRLWCFVSIKLMYNLQNKIQIMKSVFRELSVYERERWLIMSFAQSNFCIRIFQSYAVLQIAKLLFKYFSGLLQYFFNHHVWLIFFTYFSSLMQEAHIICICVLLQNGTKY